MTTRSNPNAVAHEQELTDAQVVHQSELIIGERVPGIIDGNRARGLTAVRVALIHRDAAKIVLENFHGIEHGGRPVADPGIQTAAVRYQQRKAAAGFLIADANVTIRSAVV